MMRKKEMTPSDEEKNDSYRINMHLQMLDIT
jgi:hypothetical protein